MVDAGGSFNRDEATDWLTLNGGRSTSWSWNMYEQKFRLYRDFVGVYTGLGLAFTNYAFSRNIDLKTTDELGATYLQVADSVRKYDKNKLRITAFQVPLMVEFNTSDKKKLLLFIRRRRRMVGLCEQQAKLGNERGGFYSQKKR